MLQPETGVAVDHVRIGLDERAGVEQKIDPLAGGEFAFGVLGLDAFFAAPGQHRGAARGKSISQSLISNLYSCPHTLILSLFDGGSLLP